MKLLKRISLFCIIGGILFLSGSYAALQIEQFFYPKRYGNSISEQQITLRKQNETTEAKTKEGNMTGTAAGETEDMKQVIEAIVENRPVITADTKYFIENVNLSEGTIEEKEEVIPVKYIGMNRENLIEELKAYDNNPPLVDLEKGFETIELSNFSKDRVVICKYYRPKKEEQGFYLMVADHFVIVYREDKKTIYMNTDILLENLSQELQDEIIQGKYMENEQALYNFLESYSS